MNNPVRLLCGGLRYGKVVGATFAALQPHRIERVAMDGIADDLKDKGLVKVSLMVSLWREFGFSDLKSLN